MGEGGARLNPIPGRVVRAPATRGRQSRAIDVSFANAFAVGVFQNRSVRQFLLTNLVEQNGHYAWRVNLEAISAHLEHVMSFPSFDATYDGPTLFLGGASSAYIRYSSRRGSCEKPQDRCSPNGGVPPPPPQTPPTALTVTQKSRGCSRTPTSSTSLTRATGSTRTNP